MTVTKNFVKSCCGGTASIVFYLDKPLQKPHIQIFKDNGYTVPEHYVSSGIFYCRKDTLVATSSFGTTKVTVKCGTAGRDEKLNEFESLLEKAINA